MSQPNKNISILLMDDQEMILKTVSKMLEILGYNVDTATTGEETCQMFQDSLNGGSPYRLLILDLTINNGMGGEETMAKLLTIDPDVKALVSSGDTSHPVVVNYQKYGFKGVVSKPFTLQKLQSTIEKTLQ